MAEDIWTKKEAQEFRDKLRGLREGLPAVHRKVFNRLLGGTVAGYRFGKSAGKFDKEARSFAQSLGAFRDGLPLDSETPSPRLSRRAPSHGALRRKVPRVMKMPSTCGIYFSPPLAVIVVGTVLIVEELSKGDDAEAPDLSGIPTSPEVPD